ncbi:MAG TPA: LysM domain-containing protein, partial [bacterium]|nr:LysM domain-containing protein [bacterium]
MGSCVHQSEQGFVGDPPVLEGITHVVAEGETLVGIARAYGITPQRI